LKFGKPLRRRRFWLSPSLEKVVILLISFLMELVEVGTRLYLILALVISLRK
jgi:hypothetical protein